MTEAKNQRMTIVEKFYIEQNWETMDVETLSNHTKIQKRSIQKFIEKLKDKKDKSKMDKKVESTQTTTKIYPAQDMMAKRGVAVMTQSASEIGDEYRKSSKKTNPFCVTKIRQEDV